MGRRGSAGKGGSRRSSAQRTRRAKMFCGPCRRRGGPSRSARGSRGAQRPPPQALGPPAALSRAPEPRRAPATAEPSSARCSSSSLDCGPGQRERDGAQAPALAPAPVAARAPPLASVPRCRGSRPHLRGGFDVGLDGWVIVVSRKSAAGTALRGRTHHSTPPSPLMSSGYGTPRQPRPRPIRVHTEEVTGSIPVSPTQVRGPVRDLRTGPSSPVQQRSTATPGRGTRSCTPPPAYRLVQPVAVDARYRKADGSALGVAFRAGRGQERALARRRGAGPPPGLAGCFTGGRSSASFSTRGPGRAYP